MRGLALGGSAGAAPVTETFVFTGATQDFVVPANVCQVTVEALGAGGGGGGGGGDSAAGSGAGGGGSSAGPAGTTFETGVNDGDGEVTITYEPDPVGCPSPVAVAPRFTG